MIHKETDPTCPETFNTRNYDRSLAEYEYFLRFSRDDLRGKTVLDIGSGRNLLFARQAAEEGIKVISINPELGKDKSMRKQLMKKWYRSKKFMMDEATSRTLAARAQALPLQDECVDVITGLFSATTYIRGAEEMSHAFEEMMRVLKPEGVAYFYHLNNYREMGIINQIDTVAQAVKPFKEKGYIVEHIAIKKFYGGLMFVPSENLKITKPANPFPQHDIEVYPLTTD